MTVMGNKQRYNGVDCKKDRLTEGEEGVMRVRAGRTYCSRSSKEIFI